MPDVTRIIEQTATESIYNDDWAMIDRPTEGEDGGTRKILVSKLKELFNDGLASLEELETVVGNIADTYNTSESYVVDDLCIHEYALFKCIGATTGTWDSTKWQATTIAEIIATIDLSAEAISYDNTSSGLEAENVQDAIGETITKLSAVGSASGAIATFDDGSDLPMLKLEVAIEPQQDLHGYDYPWVGGAGKNKLPMTVEGIKAVNTYHSWSGNSTTINNVTITIETSNSGDVTGIRFNGTASADITFNLASNITIPNGSYVWNNDQIVNISNLWLSLTSPNIAITLSNEKEKNMTVSNGSIGSAYIYASSGNSFNNVVFKPMIRLASVTNPTFAPYSNICPISGCDEMNVTVCGNNLLPLKFYKGLQYNDSIGNTFDTEEATDGTISGNTVSFNIGGWGRKCMLSQKLPSNVEFRLTMTVTSSTSNLNYTEFYLDKDLKVTRKYNVQNGGTSRIVNAVFNLNDNECYIAIELGCSSSATIVFDSPMLNINPTPITYEPYNGHTYTVDLEETRYGGTLDVVSGVLTVDSYGITITGTESFIYKNSNDASIYGLYVDSFPEHPYFRGDSASAMHRGVCSMFKKASYLPSNQMQDHTIDSYGGGFGNTGLTGSWIRFKESSFADYTIEQAKAKLAEFYANNQPLQIVFPMVAKTIQLTPTQVSSLMGVNNIWADTGDITDAEYIRDTTTVIDSLIARIEALENQ